MAVVEMGTAISTKITTTRPTVSRDIVVVSAPTIILVMVFRGLVGLMGFMEPLFAGDGFLALAVNRFDPFRRIRAVVFWLCPPLVVVEVLVGKLALHALHDIAPPVH